MRRGFTLIELAFVIGVIAVLAAVTVPTTYTLILRARAEEARATLHSIAHSELRHRRDHGAYLACAAEGEVPKKAQAFSAAECWKALGVASDGHVRYRYSAVVEGDHFLAVAEGDLDGDGTSSKFVLDSRTFDIAVERELE